MSAECPWAALLSRESTDTAPQPAFARSWFTRLTTLVSTLLRPLAAVLGRRVVVGLRVGRRPAAAVALAALGSVVPLPAALGAVDGVPAGSPLDAEGVPAGAATGERTLLAYSPPVTA